MRFVVNTNGGVFVEDRRTRSQLPMSSIQIAHIVADWLNNNHATMFTIVGYQQLDFHPIYDPKLLADLTEVRCNG